MRPKKCGIYFLMSSGQIVYIGKTTNLEHRIQHHDQQSMDYNALRFIPCHKDKIANYEIRWIKKFQPVYNSAHKERVKKRRIRSVCKVKKNAHAHIIGINERHMTFRKLAKKSIYGFGSVRDCTVEDLIKVGKANEAAWMYFSLSHISYIDSVLTELGIMDEWIITKPGTDREKGKAFLASQYPEETERYQRAIARRMQKHAKNSLKSDSAITRSKYALMLRNRR